MVERFLNSIGKFDPAATRRRYAEADLGHAPRCVCEGCANFDLVRPGLFPASFLALLDALGVDPAKEYEAHYLAPLDGAMSLYVGTYAFIGRRETEPARGGWLRIDRKKLAPCCRSLCVAASPPQGDNPSGLAKPVPRLPLDGLSLPCATGNAWR